jgi:hypothetical protein
MKCLKCSSYFPPGFVHTNDPISDKPLQCPTCEFCLRDTDTIIYDEKRVTKKEIVDAYKVFIRKVKGDSGILKNIVKGGKEKASSIILP